MLNNEDGAQTQPYNEPLLQQDEDIEDCTRYSKYSKHSVGAKSSGRYLYHCLLC